MSEFSDAKSEVEDDFKDSSDDNVVADIEDDAVDDVQTLELNIEALVKKLDKTPEDDVDHQRRVRKRLEELREKRDAMREIDSTYNFNLDDELV